MIHLDPSSDFEKGDCRYDIPSVLKKLIFEEDSIDFNSDDLNNRIKMLNIDLGSRVNVPADISESAIKNKYPISSGSKMSFIMEYLGVAIGKYIPRGNKVWQLSILLKEYTSS